MKMNWNTAAVEAKLAEAAGFGVRVAAEVIGDQMRRNFGTEGGGVVAPRGKVINVLTNPRQRPVKITGRQRYVAAPPGAFPGVRLGHLRRSIAVGPVVVTPHAAYATVGTNVRYGRYLEYGTSTMAARPWAMRSALMAKDRARVEFAKAVRARMGSR